jgi:CRISPR-associated endonuclease Cas2
MGKKKLTFTSQLLIYLCAVEDVLTPLMNPYELRKRVMFGNVNSYKSTLYKLYKRGWIKMVDKDAQKFIKLTKAGELEALLAKAKLPHEGKWDGKWRMIVFDIPEDCKEKRDFLRQILKRNNFFKLQASVYINPHPLNREAVKYLQDTGLIHYIRIIKIEEMDNDKDLKKHFNLS